MSRSIKFRCWDVYNERVVYEPDRFEPAYTEDEKLLAPYIFYETWQDREDGIRRPCHLMQFTGLLDKHGKEIFDKDILSLWCQADPNDYEMKAEVFWNDEQFGWFLKCYHPSGQVSIESLAEVAGEPEFIERIGNIYPELVDPKMIER